MTFPASLTSRFEPLELLGKGGMGIVHRARVKASGEVVALKLLDPGLSSDADMRMRFKAEARLASRVRHPNVVGVIDSGETPDGQLYMATELVEGRSLRRIFETEGTLAPPKVIGLARALLAGLAAIHRQGIVHRDVKPTNILVDRLGTLKIIDFGIAKDVADQIQRTRSGELLGTPWYLSPEQIRGETLTASSDVYAAGVILYEALSGRPPFTGGSLYEILGAHLNSALHPLLELAPGCPPGLADLVTKMLSREPGDRFTDAHQAHKAVRAFARESTVGPLPSMGGTQPQKPPRPVVSHPAVPAEGEAEGRARGTRESGDPAPLTPIEAPIPTIRTEPRKGRPRSNPPTSLSPVLVVKPRRSRLSGVLFLALLLPLGLGLALHNRDLFRDPVTEPPHVETVIPPVLSGLERLLETTFGPEPGTREPFPGARRELSRIQKEATVLSGAVVTAGKADAIARALVAVLDRAGVLRASDLWWQKVGPVWFHELVPHALGLLVKEGMFARALSETPLTAADMARLELQSPAYRSLRERVMKDQERLAEHPAYWLALAQLARSEDRPGGECEASTTAVYYSRSAARPRAPWDIRRQALDQLAAWHRERMRDPRAAQGPGGRGGVAWPALRALATVRQIVDESSRLPVESGAADPRRLAGLQTDLAADLRAGEQWEEAALHLIRARELWTRVGAGAKERQGVEAALKALEKHRGARRAPRAPLIPLGRVEDHLAQLKRESGSRAEREALLALEAIARIQDRRGTAALRTEQVEVLAVLAFTYLSWGRHHATGADLPFPGPRELLCEASRWADWAVEILRSPEGAACREREVAVRLLVTRAEAARALGDTLSHEHWARQAEAYLARIGPRLIDPAQRAALIGVLSQLRSSPPPQSPR